MPKLTKTMGTSGVILSMLTVAASSWACGDGTISIAGLPTLGGSTFQANAINAKGGITGFSYLAGDTSAHAFLYDGILHDLGTLGGTVSQGHAINLSGSVVGDSNTAEDEATHAFLYSGGVMLDLGTLGGSYSSAIAINNQGQVAGSSYIAEDMAQHAFLYSGGSLLDLGTLGGERSTAIAINNQGQVAGDSDTANFETHAFLYSGGSLLDLGTLGGGYSSPSAINDAGQVVGESSTADFNSHAFLYSNGSMTDLGTLGGTYSTAIAINNVGQVLGNSATAGGQLHGFLYSNGSMVDLGTLGGSYSLAQSFNSRGQVVGYSGAAGDEPRAFLWQNGTMTDLNSLLPADSGWELTAAFQISDSGRIVGFGNYLGNFQWFALDLSKPNTPPVANAGGDQTVNCQTTVTLDGSASSDAEGDVLSFQWMENGAVLGTNATLTAEFDRGSHVITLIVTDECGESSQATVTVQVGDSTNPVITSVPAPLTVPVGNNGLGSVPDVTASVVASDNCTAANQLVITQSPAAGTQLGLGSHTITVTVKDAAGNASTRDVSLKMVDATAPTVLSVSANNDYLFPVNGHVTPVTVSVQARDNVDQSVTSKITSVTCNETTLAGDIQITGDLTVNLKASRNTNQSRRIYTVVVSCTDSAGNSSTGSVEIVVPGAAGR